MREEGWRPFVLDVRTPQEAAIVSLPCAELQWTHRKVAQAVAQLPTDRDILVHCKTGIRSAAACHTLAEHGLSRLTSLDGGIIGWAREIDTSLPTY